MKEVVLGIESSCDDTSAALIERNKSELKILAHLKFGQEETLKKWGGVVPEIAARNHLEKMSPLLKSLFDKANLSPENLSAIAVTTLPGLLGPLLTGVNAAKTLALLFEKPIIPTNHLFAHLEAIHLTETVSYPYLGLLISGGHSVFFWVTTKENFEVVGTTIDDAAGEAFDKGGKILGLGYPAGHLIDSCAKFGDRNKFKFPIGLQASANAQLSFSGLKTALKVFSEKNSHLISAPQQFERFDPKYQVFYDVCASYQSAISKALVLKTKYAIKSIRDKFKGDIHIVIGGGVACNSTIRRDFIESYKNTHFVRPEFCTDNGAMIAHWGLLNLDKAITFPNCLQIDARGRYLEKEKNGTTPKSK